MKKPTDSVPRYCPEAVDRQIAADRRRHRISGREAKLIHAVLKGRGK